MAFARVILRLPNADGPRVSPTMPPKGRWPPSSRCGGTAPGVVEMRLDSAVWIILLMASTIATACGGSWGSDGERDAEPATRPSKQRF